MTEYISRDKALKVIDALDDISDAWGCAIPMHTIKEKIKEIPSADVVERCKGHKCPEQKRGKWINVFDIGTVCNQCGYDIEVRGYDILTDGEPNFCPNCGADMREES